MTWTRTFQRTLSAGVRGRIKRNDRCQTTITPPSAIANDFVNSELRIVFSAAGFSLVRLETGLVRPPGGTVALSKQRVMV